MTNCPDTFWEDDNDGDKKSPKGPICSKCDPDCLWCGKTATECTKCDSKKRVFLDSNAHTCVANCPHTFWEDDGKVVGDPKCTPCDKNCLWCDTTAIECTKCNANTYLYKDKTCLSKCLGAFYGKDSTWTCEPCDSKCT